MVSTLMNGLNAHTQSQNDLNWLTLSMWMRYSSPILENGGLTKPCNVSYPLGKKEANIHISLNHICQLLVCRLARMYLRSEKLER